MKKLILLFVSVTVGFVLLSCFNEVENETKQGIVIPLTDEVEIWQRR